MSFPQKMSAVLLEKDKTVIGSLTGAFDIQTDDSLNDEGNGSATLSIYDSMRPQMTAGRYVQISAVGIPDPFFTWKIEGNPTYDQIQSEGRVQEVARFSGPGWGAIFDEAIMLPEGSLTFPLDASWRLWSFASPGFPNTGTWVAAVEAYEYLAGVAAGYRIVEAQSATDSITGDPIYDIFPAPLGFTWPNAPKNGPDGPLGAYKPTYWIYSGASAEDAIGFGFFRNSFGLAGQEPITIDVTADNYFTLFVQGVPTLGEKMDAYMWQGWKNVTLELQADTYTIGAVVENFFADIPFNPYALLAAFYINTVYPGEVATTPTLAVLTTDDSWISYFSADEWPGYTPGQALAQFVSEVMARGSIQQFGGLTCSDFLDSAGDPYDSSDPDTDVEFMPVLATRIGSTGIDMLTKMVQEGWIDWHFTPDTLELDVWAQGSAGATTTCTFARATNIRDLQLGATRPYANALLVQWGEEGGYVWVEDNAAITAYGSRVEDVYATDAATEFEAKRLGRVELNRRVGTSRASIRMVIEPTGTNDVPYRDFGIGDYVTIPNEEETGTRSVRVLGIAADSDVKGNAIWNLELNTPWLDPRRAENDLLRSIGGKSMGTVRDLGIVRM